MWFLCNFSFCAAHSLPAGALSYTYTYLFHNLQCKLNWAFSFFKNRHLVWNIKVKCHSLQFCYFLYVFYFSFMCFNERPIIPGNVFFTHPCVLDSFTSEGKRSFFGIFEADLSNEWLRIFFAFYFHHQKYLTLYKAYYKNLGLCVCLIIKSFIRWNWWDFREVDWKIYLSADWPLELPEGVFHCAVTWVLEEISFCKWSSSACECSRCAAGVNSQHVAKTSSAELAETQEWVLTASLNWAALGWFFFLSCESLWTQTHWCWSGVLGLHRSVLLCLSVPSIPVSSTLQWLLYPERPRSSAVQEPQKVG